MKKCELNDLVIFILAFVYSLTILFSVTWEECIFWLILSYLQLQLSGRIKWAYISLFLLFLIIPFMSLFITSYMHLKAPVDTQVIIILGTELSAYRLNVSLYLTVRALALSLISFGYLTAIRYDRLVYSLIQNLSFPVIWGYSLLISFNAITGLKDEWKRIRQASRLRFLRQRLFSFYLIPLLVSAARYSQQAAMSIQTRGLESDKTFICNERLKPADWIFLSVNLAGVLLIIL